MAFYPWLDLTIHEWPKFVHRFTCELLSYRKVFRVGFAKIIRHASNPVCNYGPNHSFIPVIVRNSCSVRVYVLTHLKLNRTLI